MHSISPKPKFFPPIKTAASFLRTLSKSPEAPSLSSQHSKSKKEISYEFSLAKQFNSITKESGTFTARPAASRKDRDVYELQETLASTDTEPRFFNFYLPTSLEQLRIAAKVKPRLPTRRETRTKERIGTGNQEKMLSNEESKKFNGESLNLECNRLKEWLLYMRNQFLLPFFKEKSDKTSASDPSASFEAFKLVLRVAMQECLSQLSVQNYERSEIVNDLFKYLKIYLKAKYNERIIKIKKVVSELEKKIESLSEDSNKQLTLKKDKEEQYIKEIELLRSNVVVKEVDNDKLCSDIKKLKADRTFRIKKDLEKYNQLLSSFNDYQNFVSKHITDPAVVRILTKKRDSIKDHVLRKLYILQEKRDSQVFRLNEEQLIEAEMLTTNTEMIFFDKSSQVEMKTETSEKSVQIKYEVADKQVLTDEIVEVVEEPVEEPQEDSWKQPVITIMNENKEEIGFSKFEEKIDEISIIEDNLDIDDSPNYMKGVKRRIHSFYKYRDHNDKSTQTEDKVFIESAKLEEEELIEWMVKDRKDYLKGIQKQIFHKKNELSRVHMLISKSKNMLGDSFNFDDSKFLNSISFDESEDFLENEVTYLKSVGLLATDQDIQSWKNGYYFGYDKGKNYAFVAETSIIEEKKNEEEEKKNENATNDGMEGIRSKSKKPTLMENLKNYKKGTKVQEFHFQNREAKNAAKGPVNELRDIYIDEFIQEPSKNMMKQAKMSRKMTLKTINSLYTSAISKRASNEIQDLASFTYDEFSARYGQQVASKKLVEFLSSIMKYPDSRKTINFSKLIGISKKIGIEEFVRPKESFLFLLDLMNMVQKSNLGIIFSIEEGIDYQFIPSIRAVECSKEILSKYFDNLKISLIISKIEANSRPDPKKINKFGIIDQEFLFELLLLEVDLYFQNFMNSIWTIFQAFYTTRKIVKVFKQDVIIIARHISPDRFALVGNQGEGLSKLQDDQSHSLPVSKVVEFCLQCNILNPRDLEVFSNKGFDPKKLQDEIQSESQAVKNSLAQISENKERFGFTYVYFAEWESRFEELTSGDRTDPQEAFIVWKVLFLELQRLNLLS